MLSSFIPSFFLSLFCCHFLSLLCSYYPTSDPTQKLSVSAASNDTIHFITPFKRSECIPSPVLPLLSSPSPYIPPAYHFSTLSYFVVCFIFLLLLLFSLISYQTSQPSPWPTWPLKPNTHTRSFVTPPSITFIFLISSLSLFHTFGSVSSSFQHCLFSMLHVIIYFPLDRPKPLMSSKHSLRLTILLVSYTFTNSFLFCYSFSFLFFFFLFFFFLVSHICLFSMTINIHCALRRYACARLSPFHSIPFRISNLLSSPPLSLLLISFSFISFHFILFYFIFFLFSFFRYGLQRSNISQRRFWWPERMGQIIQNGFHRSLWRFGTFISLHFFILFYLFNIFDIILYLLIYWISFVFFLYIYIFYLIFKYF